MQTIDGSYGEGGGQLVRTALVLSVLSGTSVRITDVRAGRGTPGLRPQHVTAVRALAAVSDAETEGAHPESPELLFRPRTAPRGGSYDFDVADAAPDGSAGSTPLLVQALLLPLAFAEEASTVTLRGGTHVPWSPSYHYLDEVYGPILRGMGLYSDFRLHEWGFYPAGGGRITVQVDPLAPASSTGSSETSGGRGLRAIELLDRGSLRSVRGTAVASNLPSHIPQRMSDRARSLLGDRVTRPDVQPLRVTGAGPGAGIFLTAEYEHVSAGFMALGQKGKPSEEVAEEAVEALIAFHESEGVVDRHLGDQLLLPAALAEGTTTYRTERVTSHLLTARRLIEKLTAAEIEVTSDVGRPGFVKVRGCGATSAS